MVISEDQLVTWTHQGAITASQTTHESIRVALSRIGDLSLDRDYEIYLQGSYKNSTNIYGDSDVDVVVQLNSTFRGDTSRLPPEEQTAYRSAYPDATYTFANFRSDVLAALRAYYDVSLITEGNKSIMVAAQSGRLDADVVPCLHYRKYRYFRGFGDQEYVDGIVLDTQREGRQIISFPKPHYDNGVRKNGSTGNWYKPTVRLFKNARSYLVDNNRILSDLAPSYFLECLIYNVPDTQFGTDFGNIFCNAVNWLQGANLEGFVCQSEQTQLFGADQWSIEKARQFISALIDLWSSWR